MRLFRLLLALVLTLSFAAEANATGTTVTNVTSTDINNTYGVGSVIPITITFSAAVTVTGTPELALNNGGTASYSSGSGSATLTFDYTVSSGQDVSLLDYGSTTALTLNGGTIDDANPSPAVLTLATPGAAGSLSANKSIRIQTTTGPASLEEPIASTVYRDIPLQISLTDPPDDGSVTITFVDSHSNVTTLYITEEPPVSEIVWDPTTSALDLGGLVIASSPNNATLADGVYTVTVSYTAYGNAPATATATNVTVDHTGPVITRIGAATIDVAQNSTYTDPGATAYDALDGGDLTSQIVVTNPVDTSVGGSYTVRYNVSNSVGDNAPEVDRTVNVDTPTPTQTPTATASATSTPHPTPTATPRATPTAGNGPVEGSISPAAANVLVYVFGLQSATPVPGAGQGSCLTQTDGSFSCAVDSPGYYVVEPENNGFEFNPASSVLPSGVINSPIAAQKLNLAHTGCTIKDQSKLLQRINTAAKGIVTLIQTNEPKIISLASKLKNPVEKASLEAAATAANVAELTDFTNALSSTKGYPEVTFECRKASGCTKQSLVTQINQFENNLRHLENAALSLANKMANVSSLQKLSEHLRAKAQALAAAAFAANTKFPKETFSCP